MGSACGRHVRQKTMACSPHCGEQETEMQEMDTTGPVDSRMSDEATAVLKDILWELENISDYKL